MPFNLWSYGTSYPDYYHDYTNTCERKIRRKSVVSVLFISICTALFIISEKIKVKRTLLQALRLCTGSMAHRGSRGIAVLFLDHGTIRG